MSARNLRISTILSMIAIAVTAISSGCDREKKPSATTGTAMAGPAPASQPTATLRKMKIGYIGLTCEAPLFVAFEKGFFKDEGVEPEMVKLAWPALREGLSFGKIDATHHLIMFLLKPIEQGLNVRLTAGVHKGCLRVQVGTKSDVQKIADLKGKRIAIPGMGTPPFILASRALIAAGLDPNKDVDWKVFPVSEFELALDKGLVDAVGDSEPIGTLLTAHGKARTILDQATDAPYKDEYCCGVVVSGKLATDDPDGAARVTRAILKGAKWVQLNPTAAAKLAVDKQYISSSVELNAVALAKLQYDPSVSGGEAAIISAATEMKKCGMLASTTDPAALAKKAFLPLPNVSDDWIKTLSIEPIAGGHALRSPLAAGSFLEVGLSDVKSCCAANP